MSCTCEDALAALSTHLGLPLRFDDGACSLRIGEQPFTLRSEEGPDRLVLAALVADDLPDAPSRQLVCDLLDLGFGMLQGGLPAVGRDPDTGFIAAFAQFPCATLVAAEFPDAFDKFATFATALSDRLEAERDGAATVSSSPSSEAPAPPFGANGILPV